MKSIDLIFTVVTFLEATGIALAVPTWPSPVIDELEDVMQLLSGYGRRGFADFVTPCSFSSLGNGRMASAEWIRTGYHDMATADVAAGTGGLDASIMFELDRDENIGDAFNTTLANMLGYYTPRSSMSDLLALAVYAATRACDGPSIPYRAGRVDATAAGPTGVPEPSDSTHELISAFERQGFNQTDMVGLVACGHTLGGVHEADFPTIVLGDGNDGNGISRFDTTQRFDSKICSEYIDGNTTNPLINGPDLGKHSDSKVFVISTEIMREMSEEAVFQSRCQSLLGRMIDTVPSEVTLTEPIAPYEVKPSGLVLAVSDDGTNFTFSGTIRIRTTVRPASDITSVQLPYVGLDGTSSGIITTVEETYQGGSGGGFDEAFQFYTFSAVVPSNTSIIAFNVSVTLTDGSVELHDNNGVSFPVQSAIIYQPAQSCSHYDTATKLQYMTVVAAVDSSRAGSNITVSTTNRMARQGVVVPSLATFSTPMVLVNTTCDFLFYSATIQTATDGTYFDVISTDGDDIVVDSFKNARALSSCS